MLLGCKEILLLLFLQAGHHVQGCEEGLLVVGGEGEDGPLNAIHLLTQDGWCKNIDLPDLPEPVASPSVFVPDWRDLGVPPQIKEYVIVCGFSQDLCRYATPGDKEWTVMPGPPTPAFAKDTLAEPSEYPPTPYESKRANLQMVIDDENPLLYTVFTNFNSSFQGFLMTTVVTPSGGNSGSWQEKSPSTILLESENLGFNRKNLTGSCFLRVPEEQSDVGHEFLLTGGRYEELMADMNSRRLGSDSAVGRMSNKGRLNPPCSMCMSPEWQSNVRPSLLTGREDHACIGLKDDGKVYGMVAGGQNFYQIHSKSTVVGSRLLSATYETLATTEIYDGESWSYGPDLITPRSGAAMLDFCGELLALGGKQQDGRYDWQENYYTPNGTWVETVEDNVVTSYLDSVEKLAFDTTGKHWLATSIQLPTKMANFGATKVYSSSLLCKDSSDFSCAEDGLFPSGSCENQFWQCSHGEAILVSCDSGLVFNPEIGNCDWPENVLGCF